MQPTPSHLAFPVDDLDAHRDVKKMRCSHPYLFTDLKSGRGLDEVIAWLNAAMQSSERRKLGTVAESDELAQGSHIHGHWQLA